MVTCAIGPEPPDLSSCVRVLGLSRVPAVVERGRITGLVSGTYSVNPAYARRTGHDPGGAAIPRLIVIPWGVSGLDDSEAVRALV